MGQVDRLSSIDQIDFTPDRELHPSPADWRDQFIYFLLVDRFDDNQRHKKYKDEVVESSPPLENGIGIHGGNLKGVTRRLKYLQNLGVTTLWISPVLKNRVGQGGSLHGYEIQDFLEVDPHFGTKQDLRELVDTAHQLGMYIVLDIVINHTGDNWAYPKDTNPPYTSGNRYPFGFWRTENPKSFGPNDAVWPAELQDPDCYTRRGVITDWNDPEQAIHGDFFNLKDLDLTYKTTLEALIAIYKYWIIEADIDGYRIDTVKHVTNAEAVVFFNAIKEFATSVGKQNFFLFGEIVDSDAVIEQYVGAQSAGPDHIQALDASLDFPLYFVLEEVIKGEKSPAALRSRYDSLRDTFPHSDGSDLLVTFLDNHDQMTRPFRRFLHNAADKQQAVLGVGYLLTVPGIPAIYYGTEQGFDGGTTAVPHGDNMIRECMFGGRWGAFGTTSQHFFDPKHELYQAISQIATIRAQEAALRYGRFYFREISEDGQHFMYPEQNQGFLAYSRVLDDEELLIIMNLRNDTYSNHVCVDTTLTPPGTFLKNLLNPDTTVLAQKDGERSTVTMTLAPYELAIMKADIEPA